MGRKPLAGVVGLVGVGVLLASSGCQTPKDRPFMGGKSDGSFGVTNGLKNGWNNSPKGGAAGTAGTNGYNYPYGSSSGTAGGTGSGTGTGMGGGGLPGGSNVTPGSSGSSQSQFGGGAYNYPGSGASSTGGMPTSYAAPAGGSGAMGSSAGQDIRITDNMGGINSPRTISSLAAQQQAAPIPDNSDLSRSSAMAIPPSPQVQLGSNGGLPSSGTSALRQVSASSPATGSVSATGNPPPSTQGSSLAGMNTGNGSFPVFNK